MDRDKLENQEMDQLDSVLQKSRQEKKSKNLMQNQNTEKFQKYSW